MIDKNLIIDDDYCINASKYIYDEGAKLDFYIVEYLIILKRICDNALVNGETAKALRDYVEYANKLKGSIRDLSIVIRININEFISKIDDADQYLF